MTTGAAQRASSGDPEELEDLDLIRAVRGRRRITVGLAVDSAFFLVGTVSAAWLAYLVAVNGFRTGWWGIVYLILFYVVLAYVFLPRIHSILTLFYVPDYFIGRARTHEGLLGDPVNLAFFGDEEQLHTAMERAGWHRAENVTLRSSWRIVTSTLLRRSYPHAPVSPLYVFGKVQDFAYQQEVEGNPAQRHHVRFWRCPPGWILPGGHRADWVAAGTYDRSVGLSFFTLQVTHRIDRETDIERDHIVDSVRAANPEASVQVIRNFSTGYHSVNGGGDAIVTDGDLPQVDLRGIDVPAVTTPQQRAERAEELARPRRPMSILLVVALTMLRELAGIALIVVPFTGDWGASAGISLDGLSDLSAEEQRLLLGAAEAFLVVLGVLVVAVYALLIWRVYHGSYAARLILMILTTLSILTSVLTYIAVDVVPAMGIIAMGMDVLVLTSLSSEDAREFVVKTREYRRARRDRARQERIGSAR